MVTRAQLTQERSRLRRDELLAAAIELFAEGGARAITHRAVAARAGLPPATTTYYFESIDELIREALAAHMTQWIHELDAFALAAASPADVSLGTAAPFVASVFAQRGPEVAALQLSIFLAAAREPQLRDLAAASLTSLEGLVATMLTAIGAADTTRLSASVVSLIAGTAVRRQAGLCSEEDEALFLVLAVRDLLAAHVLGPDGVEEQLMQLRGTDG